MARQFLFLHWKASKWLLLPFVVAAFGAPLLSVQTMGDTYYSLNDHLQLSGIFPLLAASLGFVMALTSWNWDHKADHVYALSLPVARWEYALLKMGAGVVLILLPAAALLLGSLLASVSVTLAPGLNSYPLLLTGRFLFASLVSYAMLSALAAGTMRTTIIVLSVLVGAPIAYSLTADFVTNFYPALAGWNPVLDFYQRLFEYPGPLHLFVSDWALIDV